MELIKANETIQKLENIIRLKANENRALVEQLKQIQKDKSSHISVRTKTLYYHWKIWLYLLNYMFNSTRLNSIEDVNIFDILIDFYLRFFELKCTLLAGKP